MKINRKINKNSYLKYNSSLHMYAFIFLNIVTKTVTKNYRKKS